MWTNNEALVIQIKKLMEYDPISANLKNDPNLYCGLRYMVNQINVKTVNHIRGHQDETGKTLSNVEKLNVLADQLASKAVNEERCDEPKWNIVMGLTLKINGKIIT